MISRKRNRSVSNSCQAGRDLLEFDGTAGCFDLALDFFGFCLVDAFLERLRRAFDETLCFGQTEAGDGTDFLDDLDLLATVAGENDVEFVLFFGSRGVATSMRAISLGFMGVSATSSGGSSY